jgi:hypothetical protein
LSKYKHQPKHGAHKQQLDGQDAFTAPRLRLQRVAGVADAEMLVLEEIFL